MRGIFAPLNNKMCLNPRLINRSGKRKETTYNGKKGEFYKIVTYSKCGYCEQCQNERANNWVIRNYYEKQLHEKISFLTLTYADNPIFLIKKHLQDFKKRLRRHLEYHYKIKIRTFDCGEYGSWENTHRPHFHIICYNWEEEPKNLKFWEINKKGNITYLSKTLSKLWTFGIATYQNFNDYEIPYITLYNTTKDKFANAYIQNKEKAREFLKELKKDSCTRKHRLAMYEELKKAYKQAEKEKSTYVIIKEFNTWSNAIGWDKFIHEYYKQKKYDFQEYIEDKTFHTPTSWIKKLANKYNDNSAIAYMLALQSELESKVTSEKELREKNRLDNAYKQKDEKQKLLEKTFIL